MQKYFLTVMSDKDLLPCQHSHFSIAQEFVLVLKRQFPNYQGPCYTRLDLHLWNNRKVEDRKK